MICVCRKYGAWLLLISIINIVFFHSFNRVHTDAFEYTQDPVNSLAELVVEICFEVEDTQPGDERQTETGSDAAPVFTIQSKHLQVTRINALLRDQIVTGIYTLICLQTVLDRNNPPPELTLV